MLLECTINKSIYGKITNAYQARAICFVPYSSKRRWVKHAATHDKSRWSKWFCVEKLKSYKGKFKTLILQIGCVLSGGQAAGGHNVIMGLFDMIKSLHPESRLFGFLNGPHGIFTNNYMEITLEYMNLFRNTGGFDMIRKCHFLF
jgi:hypothetical protein